MEIGPVSGIRAVSLTGVRRTENALPAVFEIDPSARADDESYSASRESSDRGLEGEEAALEEKAEDEFDSTAPAAPCAGEGHINFFA